MRRSGFSLGEVLCSFMILSLLSVILVGVIPSTIMGSKASGQRAVAASLVRAEIEKIRLGGIGQLRAAQLPGVKSNGTEFTLEVEVTDATDSSGNRLDPDKAKKGVVICRWKPARGQSQSYSSSVTVVRIP